MRVSEEKLMRRCDGSFSEGFTLIELMIVILILAILVGIAVAVMVVAQKKASSATSEANLHIGEKCLDNSWFRCMEGTYAYYRDSNSAALGAGAAQYVYGRYLSYMEPKINWVDLNVAANVFSVNQSSASYGVWKNKVRSTVPNINDLSSIQGKIGVTACRPTNAAGTAWAAASNNYRTVVTLDTISHKAYWTCYFNGVVYRSGSCTMQNNGTVS
jgi:prepilin-type N-terminal cleavage/methylation domain-containing protein